MASSMPLALGSGGAIRKQINVGGANRLLRATEFDAIPIHDTSPGGGPGDRLGGQKAAETILRWFLEHGHPQADTDGPRGHRRNGGCAGGTTKQVNSFNPLSEIHFADPGNLFRLPADAATPLATLCGFLQATGTQSNFLSRPMPTWEATC